MEGNQCQSGRKGEGWHESVVLASHPAEVPWNSEDTVPSRPTQAGGFGDPGRAPCDGTGWVERKCL